MGYFLRTKFFIYFVSMNTFKNKVAIITGAGIGIGYEIAVQLAESGACIILNDIDQQVAERAASALRQKGGQVETVVGDSGDLKTISAMVERAVSVFGRLDMAVANAGITSFGHFLDYPQEHFQQLLHVNLQGSFYLAQHAARQMVKQGEGGRILLMSSVTGQTWHPEVTAYGMSKAALIFLAKSLGVELGPENITVNAIAPGATLTQRTLELEEGHFEESWKRITPLGKCATTADIAHTALFLLSEKAGHITGQTITVDGGWTAVSPPPH